MAVLALTSIQKDGVTRKRPFDKHGKMRFDYFEIVPVVTLGDIGTTIDLCDLPPGAVRVLPWESRVKTSAWGASRTLSIGHRAYQKIDPTSTTTTDEAENASAFVSALDVSSAVNNVAWSATTQKYDMFSKAGITIFATVAGGTIPVAATLSGFVAYIYE